MNIFKLLPTNSNTLLVLTLFSLLLLTSCDDNPASSDGDPEHTNPVGIELVHDGEVIIEYTADDGVTEHSHLHYHVGEAYLFEVHFLDEGGEHIHTEDLGDEYSLGWEVENEDVLEVHQHEEDGPWAFHLEGVSTGESKVQFSLNHGTHSDFETPSIVQDDAIEFHVDIGDDSEPDH